MRRTLPILALTAWIPGALAGVQITGLLFFLNPHLPFEPLPVLRGVLFYGMLLGLTSFLFLFPLAWIRREKLHGILSWSLSITLAAAAVLAWIHASYFSFYLPSGINRRLLKAAIWLTLAAVICFYTALLHRLKNRPHGRRSQTLYFLLSLASIYVVFERREAFKPQIGPDPRPTTYEVSTRPHLLVVGVEAATLDAVIPLAEQGGLPFFSEILQRGCYGRLSTIQPIRREALWTTLATGKYPHQHGIVGRETYPTAFLPGERLSLLPVGLGFKYWGLLGEPEKVRSRDREVLTIWEILSRLGISTATLGWPISSPAQESVRVGLSEEYFSEDPISTDSYPEEFSERAKLFRVRTDEINPEDASLFGPQPPGVVLRELAEDIWREDLSLQILERDPPIDALFQVLPGLGEVSRRYFGGYSAALLGGSQHPLSQEASDFLSAYYMHLDDYLSRVWEKLPEPKLLVVVSVHGTERPGAFAELVGLLRRRPTVQASLGSEGVLMFYGEGIRAGSNFQNAEIVDLMPTLLYGLGFPVAQDFDGVVLTAAFDTSFLARQPLSFLPSYETFAAP